MAIGSDREKAGREIYRAIGNFLFEHGLDPSPTNYSLLHQLITGSNPAAVAAIQEATSEGIRLTQREADRIMNAIGLGMALQVYTLIVQNATARRDLGVATASTQFFRNVGSTVGIAVFGTILQIVYASKIADSLNVLPEGVRDAAKPSIGDTYVATSELARTDPAAAAKAAETRTAPGTASTAHGESRRPRTSITVTKPNA